MPINVTHTDLMNEAVKLKDEAIALLSKEDLSAEDITRAEAMLKDAEEKAGRSTKLRDLKQRANSLDTGDGDPLPVDEKLHKREGEAEAKKWGGHFGKFLLAVKSASRGGTKDPRLSYFDSEIPAGESKDLAEGAGSTGGYLVPTEFRPMLMAEVEESAIVRPRAMVIPMSRRSLDVPALKQDGVTAGQPHWFGGMLAFWEAEAATITETEPAFRNINLTAHELTAVTHVSNNLLADSAISLSALLTGARGFPGVIAWKEDYAFLRGGGAGEPQGVLNAPATLGQARAGAGLIGYVDLLNMLNKSLPSGNMVWVANLATRAALMQIAGPTNGTSYLGNFVWGSAADGVPDQLLGFPILFTEKLPALGTEGDIMLCDFSHYYVGDRQSTTIESTDQARWLKNQTSWKVVHRVDGQPWLNAPFTLADGTTQISPFVKLNT